MTHNVSRRTLTKGAAWAAPAVVATTAIPAYAASASTKCDPVKEAVKKAFDDYAKTLPDLTGSTLRIWFSADGTENGTPNEARIRGEWLGAKKPSTREFVFEVGFRNVDTSIAVNNNFAGQNWTEKAASFAGGNFYLPTRWAANGTWDSRTGVPGDSGAKYVDQMPTERRDLDIASSFMNIRSADGLWKNEGTVAGENLATAKGYYASVFAAYDPANDFYRRQFESNGIQDLIRLGARGGASGTGRIYISWGVRPVGYAPLSIEEVRKALTDQKIAIDEKCFQEAYAEQYNLWITGCRGLAGLQISLTNWGLTGTLQNTPYSCGSAAWGSPDGFAWSHIVGNTASVPIIEGDAKALAGGGTSMVNFIRSRAGGLWQGGDTAIGKQLEYRDGIF
ncbi:hypothetical protein [Rothia sp. 11254D007CT]